jgi:hypothetical protein
MHTEHTPDDPEVLKSMGYDRRDLNVPLIKKSSTIITISCVVMFIISVPFYNYYSVPNGSVIERMMGKTRDEAPDTRIRVAGDNPVLQDNISTKLDIVEMRRNESDQLSTPGWVDKEKGKVRIPIKDAMQMIVERGVSTGTEVPAKTTGNTISQNAESPKK